MLIADSEMQKLVTFAEENAKPLKQKLECAKSIQDQIKLLESSTGYLSPQQVNNRRAQTEEKVKIAQEINDKMTKLQKDPNFLEQDEVKKLCQTVERLKRLV